MKNTRTSRAFSKANLLLILFIITLGCVVFTYRSRAARAVVSANTAKPESEKKYGKYKRERCATCAPADNQEIYVPLIDLPEAKSGELVFNSRSANEMQVTPTFYKLDGTAITGDPVSVKASEIRYVNVKKLIPEKHRDERDWGGLSLAYYGVPREMWAQFRLLGVNGGGNIDETFTVKREQRSDTQEAVWWTPRNSLAVIALGNITDAPTAALVNFGNGDSQMVTLAPHATEVIRHPTMREGSESVLVSTTGDPGSIITTGGIVSYDGSFNSFIRFYDTKRAKQPHLFANGLRLAGVTPHLVLKNTSDSALVAYPKFMPLDGGEPVLLEKVTLDPHEKTEVDLAPLLAAVRRRPDLGIASVQITNSGAPGSLIGSLYGIDKATGASYDTPLRDSGGVRTMTGSYPWKITKDYTTIVYITNISDQEAEFVSQINYEGGKFVIDPRKLAPGETAVFDLRKMRDEQMEDNAGQQLPRDISLGQFKWDVRGVTNNKIVLIGRAEMVSRSQRVSTSYSCNDPCPPIYDGWILVYSPDYVGQTGSADAWEIATFSWGATMGPYQVGATWTLDNPIATMNPYSGHVTTLTATAVGSATLDGFISQQTDYGWDGLNCYEYGTYNEGGEGPITVVGVMWSTPGGVGQSGGGVPLAASGTPPQGSLAYVKSTTITATGTPSGGTYSYSTASTDKVTLSNTSSATVTVTSKAASQATGDVTINLTYTYQGTSITIQIPFTVQKPTTMAYVSIDETGAETCSVGKSGPYKDITWQLKDQLDNSINFAIPTYDTLTNTVPNTCFVAQAGEGTPPGQSTGPGGRWGHHYAVCSTACNNGGNCSVSGTQKYFSNGFQIDQTYTMSCTTITVDGH